MTPEEIKRLIKNTTNQCYLRFKNNILEVVEELAIDHASNSIQGRIIGSDNNDRCGIDINVGLENLSKLPKIHKK
tara:strand:- start:2900 stop:3124 length:225 start_codon:yes stop_codon:yes gene_type:complete